MPDFCCPFGLFHRFFFLEGGEGGVEVFVAAFFLTNRFHVAVRLLSNRSQMTSKYGKNKKVAHEAMFLPQFDVFCYLLLNRRTATWNLFVK